MTYLLRPVFGDLGDVLARRLADGLPEVERRCVCEGVLAEVVADALQKRLLADLEAGKGLRVSFGLSEN